MRNSEIKKENLKWLIDQPVEMQYELLGNFVDIVIYGKKTRIYSEENFFKELCLI